MSSGKTHMLIGAVAGLGVARWLGLPLVEASTDAALAWGTVAASTVLATLPDIDEPRSWIAQRVRLAVTLATTGIGAAMGLFALRAGVVRPFAGIDWPRYPWLAPLVLALLGLLMIGPLLGTVLLRVIRVSAGGHRRLTHSGLLALVLAGAAWWLWRADQVLLATIPACLAFSIVVHDVGDVVTPAGVPLLFPLSSARIGLPRVIAQVGEPLVAASAIVCAYLLLQQ
jgi:membrane-bound metal-dependent hydrolase YbcI (DUF457 family)